MLEILSAKGRIDVYLREHVKFRGGKQALTTQVNNIEFVLLVDTSKKGIKDDIERIKSILLVNKIKLFMKKTINPIRAESIGFCYKKNAKIEEEILEKKYNDKKIVLQLFNNKVIGGISSSNLFANSLDLLNKIHDDIEYITNLTKEDEVYLSIDEIYKYYKLNLNKKAFESFKHIPYYLSKFNNKKNYISSLKSIVSVLNMMIQTLDIWKENNIINYSAFKKFEKIILLKLNFNFNENINILGKRISSREKQSLINQVNEYKINVSKLYDYLMNILESADKVSNVKKNKEIKSSKKIQRRLLENLPN